MKSLSFLALAACCGTTLAESTINDVNRYSYSANTGWINWKWSTTPANGAVVTESLLAGYIYSANFGWINLGNGAPVNGHTYSQASGDFGVNHNGSGILTGLAYAANVGWISFDWAVGDDPNEPRINLATGRFSGFAYGANIGWINLDAGASVFLATNTLLAPDTDNDGIADWWEYQNALNLERYSNTSDTDGDGVSDRNEYYALTDPENSLSHLFATGSYVAGGTTFTLSFPSNPGRHYAITTGTTLANWADSGLGTFSPDPGTTTTKIVPIAGSPAEPQRFFRVAVIKPLMP